MKDYYLRVMNEQFAPRTGAWIEAYGSSQIYKCMVFAPRTGAWIEAGILPVTIAPRSTSRLAQARGLKLISLDKVCHFFGFAPRTGAWIEAAIASVASVDSVAFAPRTGAWIEASLTA